VLSDHVASLKNIGRKFDFKQTGREKKKARHKLGVLTWSLVVVWFRGDNG